MNTSKYCPLTGESHCKCLYPREKISLLQVDLKSSMRKLFTDHAVYTALVMKSLVDNGKDTQVLLTRLLLNQKDIGDQIKPIVGEKNGNLVTQLLTQHINLAGDVIKAIIKRDPMLADKINQFFANGNQVAAELSSLNPEGLPLETTQEMFHMHNQFVIDMTIARFQGKYDHEQQLYDGYYNEILALSDSISHALM
jgi:hypothetical protein